jgi:hypothetical protein
MEQSTLVAADGTDPRIGTQRTAQYHGHRDRTSSTAVLPEGISIWQATQ